MTQAAAKRSAKPAADLPKVPSAGPCSNAYASAWVEDMLDLIRPAEVVWCDGSDAQQIAFYARGMAEGVFIQLNQQKLPGCYLHRSDRNDVARTEHRTFICTPDDDVVGPTNNWMNDRQAYAKLRPAWPSRLPRCLSSMTSR